MFLLLPGYWLPSTSHLSQSSKPITMAKPKVKTGNSNAVEKLTRRPPKNVLRIKMGCTDKRKVRSGKLKKVLTSLEDPNFIMEPDMDAYTCTDAEMAALELSEDLMNQIEEVGTCRLMM